MNGCAFNVRTSSDIGSYQRMTEHKIMKNGMKGIQQTVVKSSEALKPTWQNNTQN